MDLLQVVLRIVHIGAAIALGGALVFQLAAVQPALRSLGTPPLAAELARRWRAVAWTGMGLLLLSGLLTFLVFRVPAYRGAPFAGMYHGLFGVKFLAALALFHATTMLLGPGPRFERYRARAGQWLAWATLLLAIIVVVGAVMRYLPTFYA